MASEFEKLVTELRLPKPDEQMFKVLFAYLI